MAKDINNIHDKFFKELMADRLNDTYSAKYKKGNNEYL